MARGDIKFIVSCANVKPNREVVAVDWG